MPDHIVIKNLSEEEFRPFWLESLPHVFTEDKGLFSAQDMTDVTAYDTVKKCDERIKGVEKIHLVAYEDEKPAGWSTGYQQDKGRFYMLNSGVFPTYRGKGIYRRLVEEMVRQAGEKGYQEIYSFHKANNNAVIIPKLKEGFVITGTSISPKYGFLVQLSFFPHKGMKKILDYRIGSVQPDKQIQSLYKD